MVANWKNITQKLGKMKSINFQNNTLNEIKKKNRAFYNLMTRVYRYADEDINLIGISKVPRLTPVDIFNDLYKKSKNNFSIGLPKKISNH